MASNIDITPSKGKGRPKKKGFKGTPKKIILDVQENEQIAVSNHTERNAPCGLFNNSNVCFFNSDIQALFTLEYFRNHVINFTSQIPDETVAVENIKTLFRNIAQSTSNDPIRTHECVQSLPMPGYVENSQFDAEECMTIIINLFYPRINDKNELLYMFSKYI